MLCPRCGHRMDNEEANYCGRCGALLRASAPVLDDDVEADPPETRHDPWRGMPSYSGNDRYMQQDVPPSTAPTGPSAHRDPVSFDVTRILALRDHSLLQRPTIVSPGAERPDPSGSAPAGFEASLPLLTQPPETEGTDAAEAPPASGGETSTATAQPPPRSATPLDGSEAAAADDPIDSIPPSTAQSPSAGAGQAVPADQAGAGALDDEPQRGGARPRAAPPAWAEAATVQIPVAEDIPAPRPATAPAVAIAELQPAPPDAQGCLRIAGCTISVHPGQAPLVEVCLDQGAVLSLAMEGLLWASGQLQIDPVSVDAPDGRRSATVTRAPRLQARGPGTLALSPGAACTILTVELAPGAILDVAAGALLAWSPGLRAWRPNRQSAFPAGRLSADRTALALLACPGIAKQIELPAGAWITVAPHTLIATVGAIGCATLRRYRTTEEPPLVEYRLSGPGRVLLGGSRPLGARR